VNQLADWHNTGFRLSVAVNVSVRDLLDAGTIEILRRLMSEKRIAAGALTLEITEGSIMENTRDTLAVLGRLNDMGLRLSIDDFGTGYSSLAYLSRLPVQELKIDKSFVLGMAGNRRDGLIVDTTIDLGHNLGLEVVAEGVENEMIWEALKGMNCDIAQGYYISPPLPRDDFVRWAQTTKWRPQESGKTSR
jgi:EAL domain-containing protein (putative c-di-GMP-specific phosphodiesterase class I)